MKKLDIVRFAPKGESSFYDAVTAGVNNYFESNNISKFGNRAMWAKGASMMAIYLIPYAIIVSGLTQGLPWLFFWNVVFNGMGNEWHWNINNARCKSRVIFEEQEHQQFCKSCFRNSGRI